MEQTLERSVGSMGSVCRTYRFLPEDIPRLAEFDWNRLARRVFIDPVSGLIALMSPSSDHESYANGIDRMVDAIGRSLDTRSINLGSTRWRRPGDPENTGAEPDACYYLGETAEQRVRARQDGAEALAAFEAAHPPNLVVEVERNHGDRRKPIFYQEIGVPEMWRLELGPDGLEIEILDLKAPDGPTQLTASAILPLCTPDFIRAALELAVDGRLRELDDMIANAATTERR